MKMFRHIVWLLLVACGVAACSDEEESVLPNQQKQLLSFMTSTLKLVSYEEAIDPSAGEENPAFYTEAGNTVYRWITNYYDADREERPLVQKGSKVNLTITLYPFAFRAITASTLPLYTNDTALKPLLEKEGLNIAYWSFEPYVLTVGSTSTIKGLALSLEGCREGDIVELYMTYTMAYGEDWLYALEPESPLAIHFTIDLVE
uniref:FKBP-type peptidyl-prolyl cis-trans isomerase n=1 Tax=Alistipes sp. TaxID=1872444 RepID=UPI004056D588